MNSYYKDSFFTLFCDEILREKFHLVSFFNLCEIEARGTRNFTPELSFQLGSKMSLKLEKFSRNKMMTKKC
jgi:hypothetical protein